MTVEDWARREADSARGPDIWAPTYDPTPERQAYFEGILHAFSALLSDEAVEAAAEALMRAEANMEPVQDVWASDARAALQAGIEAVTKGDTE